MGHLRDIEKTIEPIKNNSDDDDDLCDFDTQPVDDDFSLLPDKLGGGYEGDNADDFQYLQNTVPCDEFFPFADAFETQMVDIGGETQMVELCRETQMVDVGGETQMVELCGETQMVDVGGETQVVELCGETQPVDLGDHAQVGELYDESFAADLCGETQVLDECETEVTVYGDDEGNEIEVYFDTQVISVEDSAQRDGNCTINPGSTPSTGRNKQIQRDSKAKLVSLSNREHPSGTILRGFTSIRAASIRASGFAARKMVMEKNNKNSCSDSDKSLEGQNAEKDGTCVNRDPLNLGKESNPKNQEDKTFDGKDVLELGNERNQSDQTHTLEEYDQQVESRNENSRKIRSSTARKLFMDEKANEVILADDNGMDNTDNTGLPLLFASEDDLGGLSYIDSQEPGELSQANALDVVDKIVKLNIIEDVEEIVSKGSTGGKSKPNSCAKGTQSVAKKAATRIREGVNGAFSWDDDLEDEGGGEFFQKKKELFFDNKSQKRRSPKSSSRKSWCLNSSSGTTLKENGNKKEQLNNNRELKIAVLADSRLLSKNLSLNSKACELTGASFKKNLIKEMDEAANAVSDNRHTDDRNDKDAPDVPDVGINTQMAADAMEALQFAVSLTDNDGNETERSRKSSGDEAGCKSNLEQSLHQKEACSSGAGIVTRQFQKARTVVGSRAELSLSEKREKNSGRKLNVEHGKKESKRRKLHTKDAENVSEKLSNVSKMVGQAKEDKVTASTGPKSLKKVPVQDQHDSLTPVGRRTRGSMQNSHSTGGNNLNNYGEHIDVIGHVSQRKRSRAKAYTSEASAGKADQAGELGNMNVRQPVQSKPNFVDYPKRRRTRSTFPLVGQEESTGGDRRSKRSKLLDTSPSTTNKDVKKHSYRDKSIQTSVDSNTSVIQEDVIQTNVSKVNRDPEDVIQANASKRDKDNKRSVEGEKVNGNPEASLKDRREPSAPECTTPVCCATPINDASPICKGDEYHKLSCRKNLLRPSLRKEINSLLTTGKEPSYPLKDSRRRRDMANVRILFSRHLDADTIKQQNKILNRLGASVASSMSDASHFVTDEFARTKNMLEAIAFGKPVVTHLWLESCGQASCLIDERSYILRDARKEKEFGFSMPVSLARASQHPLLQGQRILITPNTKPGKEMLASLVKAVNGLAVERIGRSALKDEKIPDDLLVISCEEDYETCVPFLEKGAAIYSSELLLNGIVTQRLEYERHQLFTDNVKRTRSTIWLKKSSNVYTPVCRSK